MEPVNKMLGTTDIYLIDQILKGRYKTSDRILAAGCGAGRNLSWFLNSGREIYGVDRNQVLIAEIVQTFPGLSGRMFAKDLLELPFDDGFFDHLISSAVLHFSTDFQHFLQLISEHLRVLRPGGTFFIRMASDIGIESKVSLSRDGVYRIPDGSVRFLLTRDLLRNVLSRFEMKLMEPLKTTNVSDLRSMSTLLLRKN